MINQNKTYLSIPLLIECFSILMFLEPQVANTVILLFCVGTYFICSLQFQHCRNTIMEYIIKINVENSRYNIVSVN